MNNLTDMITKAVNPEQLTLETMMAAIENLNEGAPEQDDNLLCGTFIVKRCAAMKGMEVIVISGDKAYCWPDGLAGKEVKIIRMPELPKPELSFKWDFEATENLKP